MTNILAFGGRKESGKTDLAKICTNYGYELISFATPLKTLISRLLSCSIKELNAMKNADITYSFDEADCKLISQTTSIPYEIIVKLIIGKKFRTTRHIMQFFGTDVIRKYNSNWHVNELEKLLYPNQKYVIDDVRFPNEANLINKLNGDIWFIIRDKYDNISNHISETSIKWNDFDKILVNNSTLDSFRNSWDNFMKTDYESNVRKRMEILDQFNLKHILTITPYLKEEMDKYLIHEDQFTYNPYFLQNEHIKNITVNGNELIVELDNSTILNVENIFMKEDIKKYFK